MKKESMIGRRLYAWIIDTFLLFVFVFFIDGLISTPIMENTTNINEVLDSYIINSNEYNKLQDEYEIYIYEGENRVLNENLTDEERKEYLNDERVIEVTNKLYEEQKILLKTLIVRISLSILVGSLITYVIIPLLIKRGRTIGKLIAKLALVKNETYAKWYEVILRYLLSIVFNIYLAIISLGIVPLINLLIAINNKDNKAIYDIFLNTTIEDNKVPLEIKRKI